MKHSMKHVGIALVALALGVASPCATAAQSLFASRGLGLINEPLDARARGIGGVQLGLPGAELSQTNPAAAAGILAPTLEASFQFDDFSAELGGREFNGSTARLPAIHAAFPVGERWVLSAAYGGVLDQNWAVQAVDTLLFREDTVITADELSSRGGVAALQLGGAYAVTSQIAVGLAANLYTGSVRRSVTREFGAPCIVRGGPGRQPGCFAAEWVYQGLGATAGVRWEPSEALSVSVAGSVGGTLQAESQDSLGTDRSYNLPASLSAGASGRVAQHLLLALNGGWSGWSSVTELGDGTRDTFYAGGGLEWDGAAIGSRELPLRLGARYAQLPFSNGPFGGDLGDAAERALTGGFGIRLAGGAATLDVAVERGWRDGGAGLSEKYWRSVVSLRVLGR